VPLPAALATPSSDPRVLGLAVESGEEEEGGGRGAGPSAPLHGGTLRLLRAANSLQMAEVEEAVCDFLAKHAASGGCSRASLSALQAAARGLERRSASADRLRERLRAAAEEMRKQVGTAADAAAFGARGRGRS